MAACTTDLTAVNMLTPLGFRLSINSTEFKNLEFFCTAASLPSVTLPEITANFRNHRPPMPGETIQYELMNVTFIVDDQLKNYQEVFKWIYGNAHTEELKWYDMTLHILSNQNTPNKQIHFVGAIPTSLTAVEFSTQETSVEYVTASVDFAYTSFEVL